MIETGQIWLVWEPVDMRAGIDRLSGWIQESWGRSSIQTLLGTARMNGLDPYAWLKDTLEKLPTWPIQ